MIRLLCLVLCSSLLLPSSSFAQAVPETHLSVPLLEGSPAPFTGLLISEEDAIQAISDSAAVSRLTLELAVRTRELDVSASLREAFIAEQRNRIDQLRERSWWDDNGNLFMFGLGLILGVAACALVVGLSR